MKTRIRIKDKSYDVEIERVKENLLKVRVEGENYFFEEDKLGKLNLVDRKDYLFSQVLEKSEIISNILCQKEIKTPIAGVVSKIHIKKGDTISSGRVVVTLVAMKMENEILSECQGRVREIRVKEKQFVNNGEILVVLD